MKNFLAMVLGGIIVWAVMHHKQTVSSVQADAEPARATLHEQMECAAATEKYADAHEIDGWSRFGAGAHTLHSHYNPVTRKCIGVFDYSGYFDNGPGYQYREESLAVFDPVEGSDIAGGFWKNPEQGTPGTSAYGLPFESDKVTLLQFHELLEKKYGISW
jgi:hypothetical protein